MSAGVAVRHTLGAYFYSSTTLGVAVCLHSPQTEVCSLCTRVVLGTTIGIAIHCIARLFFLPSTTLGMPSVFTAFRRKFICCVPGLYVPSARPLALPSIFIALRPEYVCCILRYLLGYNLWCCGLLLSKNILCALHDSRYCHMSSQPSD